MEINNFDGNLFSSHLYCAVHYNYCLATYFSYYTCIFLPIIFVLDLLVTSKCHVCSLK